MPKPNVVSIQERDPDKIPETLSPVLHDQEAMVWQGRAIASRYAVSRILRRTTA